MVNQEKSGKYIAEKRKQLGMTQKDLADQVGLTDKAVSKWERGKSVPDSAVLDEICHILHISFNEYLSGEDIPDEHYPDKAEQNMKELLIETDSRKKNTAVAIGALLASFFLALLGMNSLRLLSVGNIANFIDVPSFILLVGLTIFCSIVSGCFLDFLNIFGFMRRKKTLTDEQIYQSYNATKTIMILNLVVGIFLTVGQLIFIISNVEEGASVLKMIPLALLPLWYGILLDLIFMPVISRWHRFGG